MALLRGELAATAGVNVETLRFYERRGLLPAPPRRRSGYREYPVESVALVRFIQRAQDLGFSLEEIKELMTLRKVARATCGDVIALARRKLEQIDSKVQDLLAMQSALTRLLKQCSGTAPIAMCPIIESLASAAGAEGHAGPRSRARSARKDRGGNHRS